MPFLTFQVGDIQTTRARIQQVRSQLEAALGQGLLTGGNMVAQQLQMKAPIGQASDEQQGPPLSGDAPGRLLNSFRATQQSTLQVDVETSQPTKLKIVREGRKEVIPVTKMALWWPGLAHPVRRSGPSRANDFVSPILQNAPDEIADMVFAPAQVLMDTL